MFIEIYGVITPILLVSIHVISWINKTNFERKNIFFYELTGDN